MQHRHRFHHYFTCTLVSTLLAISSAQAWAESVAVQPLALRKIMQDLSKNMQSAVEGISREDWEVVEKMAPLIGDHPQPPLTERMRILSFAGANTGEFKRLDEKTHLAAQAMGQAAARRDGQAVIASFATLQNSCLTCHQSFRKSFLEHFYGQR